MILRFYNDNSSCYIDLIANNVEYCDKNFPITKKYIISKEKGKVETVEFLLKWSANELYIYDKLGSITLLERLYFKDENIPSLFFNSSQNTDDNLSITIGKYLYTKGIYIELYKNSDKEYCIITPENKTEKIKTLSSLGSYDVYISENDNKLYICKYNKKIPKYNGVGITKVSI